MAAPDPQGGLSGIWHHVTAIQALPPRWVVIAAGVAALALVLPTQIWLVSRNAVTIAHEGGHALAALVTGRRLSGIRLHSDTSGVTVSVGKPTGPGMILTAAAGYLAPPLLGLGAAWLLAARHATALLWVSIVLLIGVLLAIRNLYGAFAVLVVGGLVYAITWYATATVQNAFAYLIAWFLLIAAVRPISELQYRRRRHGGADSDADQLARLTGIPGLVWVVLFGAVALGCLVLGARWLVPLR